MTLEDSGGRHWANGVLGRVSKRLPGDAISVCCIESTAEINTCALTCMLPIDKGSIATIDTPTTTEQALLALA